MFRRLMMMAGLEEENMGQVAYGELTIQEQVKSFRVETGFMPDGVIVALKGISKDVRFPYVSMAGWISSDIFNAMARYTSVNQANPIFAFGYGELIEKDDTGFKVNQFSESCPIIAYDYEYYAWKK